MLELGPVCTVKTKDNGPAWGPSFLVMVEVARIELASDEATGAW